MTDDDGRTLLRYFAANVRRLRGRAELTQAQLAEKLGMQLRALQDIEQAKVNITLATLARFARALDVRPTAMLRPAKLAPPRKGRPPT